MTRQRLEKRLRAIGAQVTPPLDPQFTHFARGVIEFGGQVPTPDAVERLARWYAGGYRSPALPE